MKSNSPLVPCCRSLCAVLVLVLLLLGTISQRSEAGRTMQIVFISLEFTAGTFSGNGVYATSQVRALAALGHQVLVISAKPAAHSGPPRNEGAQQLFEVPVPVWGRLDASAPWQEFAAGVRQLPELLQAVADFQPQVVLGVDWSSLQVHEALAAHPPLQHLPYVFLNYRIFSRTAEGPELQLLGRLEAAAVQRACAVVVLSRSDASYMQQHLQPEAASSSSSMPKVLLPPLRADMHSIPILDSSNPTSTLQSAAANICSAAKPDGASSIAVSINASSSHNSPASSQGGHEQRAATSTPNSNVTLDASRSAAAPPTAAAPLLAPAAAPAAAAAPAPAPDPASQPAQAAAQPASRSGRHLLTCCVRLSPEKEPLRFVELVEQLQASGLLQRMGVTPLLCGAAQDEYAQAVKGRLRAAAPGALVVEHFLGPQQLAAIYRGTLLNVHPCSYDAYGMTVVEAASQGAPSLVQQGGAVGATDLLDAAAGEVLLADMGATPAQLAQVVERLLQQPELLANVGSKAAVKARSWDEAANAAELVRLVEQALPARPSQRRPSCMSSEGMTAHQS